MESKKDQVWVIVETDDADSDAIKVHQQSIDDYDKAFGKALSLAQNYRADTKLACEITHNKDEGKVDVEVLNQYHHFTVHAVDLPRKGKNKPKKKDRVTVICYGRGHTYDNAEQAITFYTDAVHGCDPSSSECSRYNYILDKLRSGAKMIDADLGC